MLTEGDKLEEWAVNLINDYEASGDYTSSEPKRIKRFSGEIVANPEAYYELFEMARSQNLTGKELVQTIRSIEDLVLGNKSRITNPKIRDLVASMSWNPTSRKKIVSDVIHHLYAQRTGGDTLRKLSQQERKIGRNILRAEGFSWGNIDKNLLSLFRSWHTKQERLKGAEKAAAESLGVTDVNQLENIKIHAGSQRELTSDIVGATTGQEAVFGVGGGRGMLDQMQEQQAATAATMQQVQPVVDQLDAIVSDELGGRILKYDPNMSDADLQLWNAALDKNTDKAQQVIENAMKRYAPAPGTMRLHNLDPISTSVYAALKTLKDNPTGAALGVLFDAYNRETITKLEQGDIGGAATDVGMAAVGGSLIEAGSKLAGAEKLVGRVAAPLAGFSLVTEGREGSTTDYLLETYGEKIGMNQQRPSWGTEFGEMNTQKPQIVEAAEQGIDYLQNTAMKFGQGVVRFVRGGLKQKEEERKKAAAANLPYLPNIR